MKRDLRVMTTAAMFAALIAIATMYLRIPGPTGMYHLGDGIIYACALLMGPGPAALAAAVGSAGANLLLGLPQWAPWTFVIKGLTAAVIGAIGTRRPAWGRNLAAMAAGALITICGYALATWVMYGWAAVPVEIYGNIGQTGFGIIIGAVLFSVLRRQEDWF